MNQEDDYGAEDFRTMQRPTAPRISPEAREVSATAFRTSRLRGSWSEEGLAQLIQQAIDSATEPLVEALRCFLEDDRFQVTVGGNPNVVPVMVARARKALEPYRIE